MLVLARILWPSHRTPAPTCPIRPSVTITSPPHNDRHSNECKDLIGTPQSRIRVRGRRGRLQSARL
eukprot:3672623-Pyramimonas_sp.AAC.1